MEDGPKRILDQDGKPFSAPAVPSKTIAKTKRARNIALAVGAAVAFAATLITNIHTIRDALFPPEDVKYAVTVETATGKASGGPRVEIPEADRVDYTEVATKPGEELTFEPSLPFKTAEKDGTIVYDNARVGITGLELDFPFPAIDIKIENNSKNVVFIKGATVEVLSVVPDETPLLVEEWHGIGGIIEIVNYGWGSADDTKARFHVTPATNTDTTISKDIEETLGTIEAGGQRELNIKAELGRDTIRAGMFKIPEAALYGNVVNLTGSLGYRDERKSVFETRIATKVPLITTPLGPIPPSYFYDLNLKVAEGKTIKHLDLSQEVQASKTDRFQFVVNPDQSATYHLKVSLDGVGGRLKEFSLAMKVFRPQIAIHSKAIRDTTPLPVPSQ